MSIGSGEFAQHSGLVTNFGSYNQLPGKSSSQRFLAQLTAVSAISSLLSACATPVRMHSEMQLNDVARGCGLAMGELIQDEEQKKLLLMVRNDASLSQRACVARWARRNGLKAVFVNMKFPAG